MTQNRAPVARMHTAFLTPDSRRWRTVLDEIPHDLYHLPDYLDLTSRYQERGVPLAFIAEEREQRFLVPLIVRSDPPMHGSEDGLLDATGPRSYPGPLLSCAPDRESGEFLTRAVEAFRDGLREHGIVAAFVRMHPLFPVPVDVLNHVGMVVEHQSSISIDLTLSREELWGQTRHNHRRVINAAPRRGYVAHLDRHWDRFGSFVDAHRETMSRVGATDVWALPPEYFLELRQLLGDRLHLWTVQAEGKVAAAALFSEICGIVGYLATGTRDRFVNASPSKILLDAVRWWAKERGNHVLHLGGTPRKNDSLFQFKAGFSPVRHSVASWRIISDMQAYRRRLEQWETAHGERADGPEGFFPGYRKTVQAHASDGTTHP